MSRNSPKPKPVGGGQNREAGRGSPAPATVDDIKAAILRALELAPSRRGWLEAGKNDSPLSLSYAKRDKRGEWRKHKRRIGTLRGDAEKMALFYPRCGGVPVTRLPYMVERALHESGKRWAYRNDEGRLQYEEALGQLTEKHKVERIKAGKQTSYLDRSRGHLGEMVQEDVVRLKEPDPSASGTSPNRRGGRKQRADAGNKLKAKAKKDLVWNHIDKKCKGHWDGSYEQLSAALKKEQGLKISDTQLWRYLKGTKYVKPKRELPRTLPRKGEKEAVADDETTDIPEVEAWIMPDDDDEGTVS